MSWLLIPYWFFVKTLQDESYSKCNDSAVKEVIFRLVCSVRFFMEFLIEMMYIFNCVLSSTTTKSVVAEFSSKRQGNVFTVHSRVPGVKSDQSRNVVQESARSGFENLTNF